MKHIFISYKKPEDGDFADAVVNKIEKACFSSWIDNDRLEAGEDWRRDIDQAIKESSALIVIMSPEARASEYVTYEWAFALGAGINVIPILLRKTELHPQLEALQYLDFTSYNHRPWDDLIRAIKKATSYQDTPYYIKQAIAAIHNVSASDRESAINTLAEANYCDILIEALSHPLHDVRSNASKALGKVKESAAVPGLIEALHNPDVKVRSNTCWILGAIKDETAVPALLEALNDPEAKVRRISAWALGEIKSALAVPGLIYAVSDSDFAVRINSIKALGAIKAVTATQILVEVTQDPNENIQKVAKGALKRIYKD